MKLAYLSEVAALIAAHSQLLIEQPDEISSDAIGDYYVLSRNRFNRWMRALEDTENQLSIHDPLHLVGRLARRSATNAIVQQILINDMMIRVWTVLVLARDVNCGIDRIRPVARNIHLGHLSVRHKALRVALADDSTTPEDLLALDKLRKSTERWTDLLCCSVMGQFNLWEYAFNKERAMEFLRDRSDPAGFGHRSRAWVLILAGMRHSFQNTQGLSAPIHDDDRRLVRLMLNCFPEAAPEMAFWMGPRVRESRNC